MRHPVRTAKRQLLRFGSCVLSALLALSSVPVSAVDNGVSPVYDEAYYAMTDYYGNLTEGSVVKSYLTNGYSTLTDYGQYDEVLNLTDGTVPSSAGGMTTFRFDAGTAPSHFYFEGKTTRPFEALPWTLAVSYKLNGVPTRAEELAGKTGVVEINLDAIPNPDAIEYADLRHSGLHLIQGRLHLPVYRMEIRLHLSGSIHHLFFPCLTHRISGSHQYHEA